VGRATKDRRNPRAHTEGARPRTGGHPDRLDVGQPLFVIPEEDEPGLADIQPPEFAASPHTPRTHPRYSFRPSPSRTPPPEDLSPLRTTLEDAFREADEALFGPRLTRRQAPPLPDDVVQRYPSERKKKKPK
jgi:hypothetical protein